ncbi:MAG: deoxyribose-phosphate aldolase [Candidatus Cloacimonetes bacterium]|nr:deoxyribose-phosphate aldolase [Candidatus Cloacimonadota bacterium]
MDIKKIAQELFSLDATIPSRSGGAHEISLESITDRSTTPDQWPVEPTNLQRYIDHTILKPDTSADDIIAICAEAETHHFRSVCINSIWAKLAKSHLPTVDLCCVIGFPLGAVPTAIKTAEAALAIAHGAAEIDMVISVGHLLGEEYEYVYRDIEAVANLCRMHGVLLKVIMETCLLSDEDKVIACLLSKKAGADFVKTSTGFSSGGATVADVALMRNVVGPKMGVKAAGGVRTKADALAMLEAGANRIGASSGLKIITE